MKTLIRTVIILCILIAGLFAFLLTPTALHLSLRVAKHYLPGLSYAHAEGILIGPIDLDDVVYKRGDQTITIRKLHVDWHLFELLEKNIHIQRLTLTDVTVINHNKQTEETLTTKAIKQQIEDIVHFQFPHLSYHVELNHVLVRHLSIWNTKGPVIQLRQLLFTYHYHPNQWQTQLDVIFAQHHPIQTLHFKMNMHDQGVSCVLNAIGDRAHIFTTCHGNADSIEIATTHAALLGGTINIHGAMSLNSQRFQIAADLANVNLASLHPFLPVISGKIQLNENQGTITSTIDLKTSAGSINALIEKNAIWTVHWNIALQQLAKLNSVIGGSVVSKGELIEGDNHIRTQGSADLKSLRTAIVHAKAIHMDWSLNEGDRLNALINANGINYKGNEIRSAHLKLKGTLEKHWLTFDMQMLKRTLSIALQGSFVDEKWKAIMPTFTIHRQSHPAWRLQRAAHLQFTKDQFSLTDFCLQSNDNSQLCIVSQDATVDALNVQVKGHVSNEMLNTFLPQENAQLTRGRLVVDLSLTGSLDKPLLNGNANLIGSTVVLPRLGITLENTSVKIDGRNAMLVIEAQSSIKQRPLTVVSRTDFSKPNFPTNIDITSDNTPIINTPEYHVLVSSAIHIEMVDNAVNVSGSIDIPIARITPVSFASVASLPNEDIVYVGEHTSDDDRVYQSNIHVTLGNDVTLKAHGIDAQLGGSLQITGVSSQALFATGQIVVKKGTYSIFGQTLTIAPESYINYTHNLLSHPIVNIRATKSLNTINSRGASYLGQSDLIVGVEAHGSIRNPKISFFSQPASLSQTDILSYLLLGYAGNSKNSSKDYLMSIVKILATSGKTGDMNFVEGIQKGLGLSELGVESSSTLDASGSPLSQESSFVLGKSLSKNLYLRYSVGFGEMGDVVELRYYFHRFWAAQIDSNQTTNGYGGDLLYMVEKN